MLNSCVHAYRWALSKWQCTILIQFSTSRLLRFQYIPTQSLCLDTPRLFSAFTIFSPYLGQRVRKVVRSPCRFQMKLSSVLKSFHEIKPMATFWTYVNMLPIYGRSMVKFWKKISFFNSHVNVSASTADGDLKHSMVTFPWKKYISILGVVIAVMTCW